MHKAVRIIFFLLIPFAIHANPAPSETEVEPTASPLGYMDAVILGVVEGVTEYLPISSTGHLILTNQLLGLDRDDPVLLEDGTPLMKADGTPFTVKGAADAYAIVIQGGAILAVVVLYWSRIQRIVLGFLGKDPEGLQLGIKLIVAFMPAAVLGLLLDDWIESKLFFAGPIASALFLGAFLMWFAEHHKRKRMGEQADAGPDLHELAMTQCLIIGFLQCVAMWPGTSRSMMTIVGGYLVGLSPVRAAEFSFLLGLITLSAASGYTFVSDGRQMIEALSLGPVVVGILVSFVAALLAVRWLVGYLSKHGLGIFAWYRIVLAVLVLVFMV